VNADLQNPECLLPALPPPVASQAAEGQQVPAVQVGVVAPAAADPGHAAALPALRPRVDAAPGDADDVPAVQEQVLERPANDVKEPTR
jgi:hypothetical protein